MNLRPRTLFLKIFLWFCFTVAMSSTLMAVVALATGTQPFGRRWIAIVQDLYAHSAVDFYSSGGVPALDKYLDSIRRNAGIEGHLIDAQGYDISGTPFPVHATRVYRDALLTGRSQIRLGRYWTAATVLDTPPGAVFVMEAHPLEGFFDGTFFRASIPRLAGASLLVALCCLLLARHITQPIQVLQSAAARMAAGDLKVRTLPALRGRTDELASMADAFDRMAARIEALLQAERQMLADISHELRSPLTRIGVSLELLRRGQLDVVEPMQADLDRVNEMIGQILDLMRFELAESTAAARVLDLLRIVEDVVEAANREGRAEGTSVLLTASPGPLRIAGEEALLRSSIENIVRNALQYCPAGGRIDVTVQKKDTGHVAISVDDDGPGVPAEALPHLFTPFFRVPGSSEAHPEGSGLGLSVSARVAARYGGAIEAVNRQPHGLSVRMVFPLKTA